MLTRCQPDSGSPRQRLAFLLWDLADLIQTDEGRRSFRAKAYRAAIWSLDRLSPALEDPAEEIMSVPGLGPGMVRLISEFRSDGRIAELEDLGPRYPAESGRLRRLPRMTASILRSLKVEAGVETADELILAIETGAAAAVKGVGMATMERWLDVLVLWHRQGLPAHHAAVLAVTMRRHLADMLGTRVAVGGEVRRVTEWVNRIDLLVETDNPADTRHLLRSSVIGCPTASGVSEEHFESFAGLALVVGLTSAAAWGSGLILATGPPAHLERLGDLGEHRTEHEAYSTLGGVWMPPPARETAHTLSIPPDLILSGMIRGDLHVHSAASPDGKLSLDEVVEKLSGAGFEYAVITDHTIGLRFGGLDANGLWRQREEIEAVNRRHPELALFQGAEVNIDRDGALDIDDATLNSLDLVVAGVHSHFDLPESEQTSRVIRALSNPAIRVLAHPTGRRIGLRAPLRLEIGRVLEAAHRHGVALEANGHRDRLDLSSELARRAVDQGVMLAANSDAHRPGEFVNIENAVATLQRANVERRSVINALQLRDFREWLAHRP
ncbi:MAG: PHP domain-containing protein [Acidimicrobiia bacterium]